MTHTQGAPRGTRRGFTLVEMLISVVVMTIVTAAAASFYQFQGRALKSASGRLESVQNLRYVENIIDRELRLAGGVPGQPLIVMAHPLAVVFNVNLVTRVAGDRSAVYYNPNADSLATESFDSSRALPLPVAGRVYPTQNYNDASGNRSGAETIAYYLLPDPSSGRNDIYTLFRRVNDRDSTVVARDIQVPTDTAYFFRYWRTDATGTLSQIPNASLPIYWDNAAHITDSLRVVDMRINTWYHDPHANKDIIRGVQTSTKLLNAGLLTQATCGSAPLPASSVVATLQLDSTGTPAAVHVTWNASPEETGGEKDVALYMIQRRASSSTGDWTTLANLPANASATYSYDDRALSSGSWTWAIVAQDCSPSNSAQALSASVTIP